MHSITVVTINAEMRYYCRLDKYGMHQNERFLVWLMSNKLQKVFKAYSVL